MTPEEMRIAIAKDQGWKSDIHVPFGDVHWHKGVELAYESELPDYCKDLNAIHAAEQTIENKVEWLKILWRVCNGRDIQIPDDSDCLTNYLINIASATIAQRAEAYLRTKGLWKD